MRDGTLSMSACSARLMMLQDWRWETGVVLGHRGYGSDERRLILSFCELACILGISFVLHMIICDVVIECPVDMKVCEEERMPKDSGEVKLACGIQAFDFRDTATKPLPRLS